MRSCASSSLLLSGQPASHSSWLPEIESQELACPCFPFQRDYTFFWKARCELPLLETCSPLARSLARSAFVAFERLLELEWVGAGSSGEGLARGRHALCGGGVLGTQ